MTDCHYCLWYEICHQMAVVIVMVQMNFHPLLHPSQVVYTYTLV